LRPKLRPNPTLHHNNNNKPPPRLQATPPAHDIKDIAKIRASHGYASGKFSSFELDICYPVAWGSQGVEARLASLCAQAVDAVKSGHNILVLTDRALDAEHCAIPALLAT
ncbi:MAG: glutamate synthase central domain-containing protein, partial [bacterium]